MATFKKKPLNLVDEVTIHIDALPRQVTTLILVTPRS